MRDLLSPRARQIAEDLRARSAALKAKRAAEEAAKRKPPADVLDWPKPLSQMELCRRQRVIDGIWEGVISERRQLNEAEEAERKLHEFVWGKR